MTDKAVEALERAVLPDAALTVALVDELRAKSDGSSDCLYMRASNLLLRLSREAWNNHFAVLLATGLVDEDTSNLPKQRRKQNNKKTQNPKKEFVAEAVRAVIEQRGHPVGRAELYAALVTKGIRFEGNNPETVLSTMLWRMKNRVHRLSVGRYWLPERPYEAAGYSPSPAPISATKANEEMK